MTSAEWKAFEIPVSLAFFLKRSVSGGVTGFYPSPAGAVETTVPAAAWSEIEARVGNLRPDIEALLVRRGESADDAFVAPLDECYRLIGIIRREWEGFTGGDEVPRAVDRFFLEVDERCGGLS